MIFHSKGDTVETAVEVFMMRSNACDYIATKEVDLVRLLGKFKKRGALKFCFILAPQGGLRLYLYDYDLSQNESVLAALHHTFPDEEEPEMDPLHMGLVQPRYLELVETNFIGAGYCANHGTGCFGLFEALSCLRHFGKDQPSDEKESVRLLNLVKEKLRERNILQPKSEA